MSDKKQAIFPISIALLGKLLGLPDNVEAIAAEADWINKSINLKVAGEGLPNKCRVVDGQVLWRLMPLFESLPDGRVKFKSWE